MQKLFLSLLALFVGANCSFAQTEKEEVNPLETLFEMEEKQIQTTLPQKVEVEVKNSQAFENLQNDFFELALKQSEKDFAWVENLILISIALILFVSFAFAIAFTLQYFFFKKLLASEVKNFENTSKEKMRELEKICELEKHNLQAIVDSQQKILEEMKEKLGLQQKLPIEKNDES